MDEFIEKQEAELYRRLVEKFNAEGGPTYDEVMRSWKEWRERHKRIPTQHPPDASGGSITTSRAE